MKKIYTLVALIAASATLGFAQRNATKTNFEGKTNIVKAERTPTGMITSHFANGTPTLYRADQPGYVTGSNAYGDFAKGQQFNVTSSYSIEGVSIYFGAGDYVSNDANSKVSVTVWDMDGTGTSNAGAVTGPGTVLGSVDLLMSTIATDVAGQQLTQVMFASPITVTGNYVVGIDMQNLATNDTVGIVSTTDGDYPNDELSWEQWDDASWYTIDAAWGGLKLNLGVFPIVACLNQLTGTATGVDGTCTSVGSLAMNITNATGPIDYIWYDSNNDSIGATATMNNISAGTYVAEAYDELGCYFQGAVTVTSVAPISIVLDTIVNASSASATDGSITVTATGGAGNLIFTWSGSGSNSETASNLAVGSHTLIVSDGTGCADTALFTVSFTSGIITNTISEIAITPNPASSVVNVSFVSNNNASVKLFNITGEVVYNETIAKGVCKSNINVSELSNGVYFLQVISGNSISTKKIIKN